MINFNSLERATFIYTHTHTHPQIQENNAIDVILLLACKNLCPTRKKEEFKSSYAILATLHRQFNPSISSLITALNHTAEGRAPKKQEKKKSPEEVA